MSGGGEPYVYHFGGHPPLLTARLGEVLEVFTEDAFNGSITAVGDKPREKAPFPRVNPLTGPIAVEGVAAGDVLAIHLVSLTPARDWGVATISPNFGLLSGTRYNPNLQPEHGEEVWIWQVDTAAGTLSTVTGGGRRLTIPLEPFHGIVGVAPAHGEVRLSVVPDAFGGNLDLRDLRAGTTLYLRANVDRAHVYIGDGHLAQGDGEFSGTAVEGALRTRLAFGRAAADGVEWPRLETDTEIGVIGCTRPLEDTVRIATAGLVRWIAELCGLPLRDAYELATQTVRIRIGNLVNPLYSVAAFIEKRHLPDAPAVFGGLHGQLRALGR